MYLLLQRMVEEKNLQFHEEYMNEQEIPCGFECPHCGER